MKFNSLFLLIISLATSSFLTDIHPAAAQSRLKCPPKCPPIITSGGTIRGATTIPVDVNQRVEQLKAQGNFAGAERELGQFLVQAEQNQDVGGQAAAHQALGDLYTQMNKPDLASGQFKRAGVLLRQIQLQRR